MTTYGSESSLATASLDEMLENPNPIAFPGDYDALLERLQGNILKGHGRDFTVNIFLRFNDGATAERIRAELKRLASEYVTSAARQLLEAEQRRKWGLRGRLFGNVFLSRKGYEELGFAKEKARDRVLRSTREGPANEDQLRDRYERCRPGAGGLHHESGRAPLGSLSRMDISTALLLAR